MDSIESYKLITPPNRIQGPKKLCYESQDNVRLSCLNLLFFHTVWNFQIHPRFVKTDLPMDYPQLMMLETPWFWVNYNNSLNWIKAILGWFLLLTMIIVRSQWGRYNLPRWFQQWKTQFFRAVFTTRGSSSLYLGGLRTGWTTLVDDDHPQYPLVMTNIAIENTPFIVYLPIQNGDFL